MTDSSAIIAVHEAAHAAACYILGPYPIEKLEAWETSGKMVHLPTEDELPAFDGAVISMAGQALTDSMGLERLSDNHADNLNAAKSVVGAIPREAVERPGSKEAAGRAAEVAEEYAKALVRTERFRNLALDLAAELHKRKWMWGPDVYRFLKARDPLHREHPLAATAQAAEPGPSGRLETLVSPIPAEVS